MIQREPVDERNKEKFSSVQIINHDGGFKSSCTAFLLTLAIVRVCDPLRSMVLYCVLLRSTALCGVILRTLAIYCALLYNTAYSCDLLRSIV